MAQLVARKPRLVADTAARVRVMGDNQLLNELGVNSRTQIAVWFSERRPS